jgi:hypothetical protein
LDAVLKEAKAEADEGARGKEVEYLDGKDLHRWRAKPEPPKAPEPPRMTKLIF